MHRIIKERAADGINTITTEVDEQGNIVSQWTTLLAPGRRRYIPHGEILSDLPIENSAGGRSVDTENTNVTW